MNQILDKLEQTGEWKKIMRQSCKKNGLKTSLVNQLTLIKLRAIGPKLLKSHTNIGQKIATQWLENELKTFNWLLVAVSTLSSKTILQFQNEQWQLLQSIFKCKDRYFLKFQARKLIFSCFKKNKNWTQQESKLFKQILPNVNLFQKKFKDDEGYLWNEIAHKIFEISGQKYFRTGKHCRERWLNHLDPTKQRGDWTIEEDLILLNKVHQLGKKWSQFAIQLNRTEHSVKNRFNSLLIKQKRLYPDITKQQKLIKLTKKMLQERQSKQLQGIEQQSKQESEPSEIVESYSQKIQVVQQEKHEKAQKMNPEELNEQKKVLQDHVEDNIKNTVQEIHKYVMEQQEIINQVGITAECHPNIYSPYWSYSPNGTPNNYINSSSPMSYYLNYNFTNCFARFTNQLPNFSTSKSEQNT